MTSRGRPPLDPEQRRSAPVPVRFTAQERALVEAAAGSAGVSVSAWVRQRAVKDAKRSSKALKPPPNEQAAQAEVE
ncbi:plasmid mobilization protein [Williamsia muralis]|uniref:DUF1778 domain-containing protein n=1 Tax=Williamsia marianensis TaxID=85044 RepID=A0ABU4F2E4_WILMA|nr:hypothetical protein [Williamsia muralis]MDV7137166.1 hypothetical protein [Williamsia muralis]